MTRRSTPNGRAIADQTRALARELATARVQLWTSLLARPQLSGPVVSAVLDEPDPRRRLDLRGWERRLATLVSLARRAVTTRRVGDRRRYEAAVGRAAQRLAAVDLDCTAVLGCTDAIALWSGRRLPEGHRWAGHRLHPARTQSRAWLTYWRAVEHARALRQRARNAIVVLNEGLVIHFVASRGQWMIRDAENGRSALDRQDLQQHAREGLMVAAARFDPERRDPRTGRLIQFSTYATWWMRHHVERAHQQGAAQIRLPLATQVAVYKLGRLLDRWPDLPPEELARRAKLSLAKCEDALQHMGWHMASLDAPLGYHEGRPLTLAEVTPDPAAWQDEQLDQERIAVRLLALLEDLDPEAKAIVGDLYGFAGESQTPQQIARRRQVPRERVDQIHHRALASLRGALEESRP